MAFDAAAPVFRHQNVQERTKPPYCVVIRTAARPHALACMADPGYDQRLTNSDKIAASRAERLEKQVAGCALYPGIGRVTDFLICDSQGYRPQIYKSKYEGLAGDLLLTLSQLYFPHREEQIPVFVGFGLPARLRVAVAEPVPLGLPLLLWQSGFARQERAVVDPYQLLYPNQDMQRDVPLDKLTKALWDEVYVGEDMETELNLLLKFCHLLQL